jgi:hypothetical protein
MKSNVGSTILAAGTLAAVTLFGGSAQAQSAPAQKGPSAQNGATAQNGGSVQVTPYPSTSPYSTPTQAQYKAPVGAEQVATIRPNTVMLGTGALAFLGAYVPSLVVAASSDHDDDEWLYVPLAGPWIDLASRGCGDGPQTPTCGTNGFERAALIGSGVVQALGVIGIVASFAMPQKRMVTHATTLNFAPTTIAGTTPGSRAQGIMAYGTF